MSILFVEYPKCSTCQKAKKWLEAHQVDFEDRHIVEQNPTRDELDAWQAKGGFPLKKLFNTSGQLYRQLELKDKLKNMSKEEQLAVLSSNGMLVKRPVVVGEDFVLTGFKEAEWEEKLNKKE